MSVFYRILYIIAIIAKGLFVLLQMLFMLICILIARVISTRRFKNELIACGIHADTAKKLSRSYKGMISINSFR